MEVEFLEPAYLEFEDAVHFYNFQSEGLGKKFISEINRTLAIIKNYPDSFSEYTRNTRKAVVNTFPYNIVYALHNTKIIILAIAHQHRKPNYWMKRNL